MYELNRHHLQQFWQIAKLYWDSEQRTKARFLLVGLIVLSIGSSVLIVFETIQRGEIISSLAARDGDRFWRTFTILVSVIVAVVPLIATKLYVQARLALNWRRWLTDHFVSQFLNHQNFYQLSFNDDIDNPDQRIAEDINIFSQQTLFIFTLLIDSVVQVVGFIGILMLIYPPLIGLLLVYCISGTLIITFVFGRTLTLINFEQLKREADFRFSLIRIRDYAESIAFYGGEKQEYSGAKQKLLFALKNFNRLIGWQYNLDLFQNGYEYITTIIPLVVLAPSIFVGQAEVGSITQSQAAFQRIWLALSLIVIQFEQITVLMAAVGRLSGLNNRLNQLSKPPIGTEKNIKYNIDSCLAFDQLTLQIPNTQTTLIHHLCLTVSQDQRLLIMGASGIGKSSLLRAVAGLWQSGTGTITRPKPEDILFLPQRPYLTINSLRHQFLYPRKTVNEQHLWQVLEQVHLLDLVKRYGGLDAVEDWTKVLSTGEQQRIAFVRLLLHHPLYVVLDEATSALDENNQNLFYSKLQKTSVTYVSIGHRHSLLPYHQQVLKLTKTSGWQLFSVKDFELIEKNNISTK